MSAVAPPVQTYAMAMVLPAQGSADIERYITDNIITTGVNISSAAPSPPPGRTNLFVSADHPAIGAAGAAFTYIVGNNGPDATTAPVTLTVTTPFYVNFDRTQPLPPGCVYLLQDPRPNIPEIVQCGLPAGLAPGHPSVLTFPLALVPGGPVGPVFGISGIRVANAAADVDPDKTDNIFQAGVIVLTPSATPPAPLVARLARPRAPAPALPSTSAATAADDEPASTSGALASGSGGALVDLTLLGQRSDLLTACLGSRTVTIPVRTPAVLDMKRLKLTITAPLNVVLNLQIGPGTQLRTTNFAGTP